MSKSKLGLFAVAAAAFCFAQSASAREFADIYTECGLGAMIAPNNAAVAAVTNVTWDLGTTAISSNASSADSCKGGKTKTRGVAEEQLSETGMNEPVPLEPHERAAIEKYQAERNKYLERWRDPDTAPSTSPARKRWRRCACVPNGSG